MPAFEPGNQFGSLARGVPKGTTIEVRRAMRSLAMAIRDQVHPDKVVAWLVAVWQGKDPLTGEVVPLEARERALKMLLDRGWGQAAQMLVVEGQITNEVIAAAPPTTRLPMTLEQINARRAALRAALPTASTPAAHLDVPSTEAPA